MVRFGRDNVPRRPKRPSYLGLGLAVLCEAIDIRAVTPGENKIMTYESSTPFINASLAEHCLSVEFNLSLIHI